MEYLTRSSGSGSKNRRRNGIVFSKYDSDTSSQIAQGERSD